MRRQKDARILGTSLLLVVTFPILALAQGRLPGAATTRNPNFPMQPIPSKASRITPPGYDKPLEFSARTELVIVPVTVSDKNGAHVSGLTQEDFTLSESGKPQPIAHVEEVRTSLRRLGRPSRPPGVFSNTLGADPTPRRLTIVVLDMINTPYLDQTRARDQLVRYLADNVDENSLLSLLTFSRRGVRVIHDFSTEPRVLIAALRRTAGQTHVSEGADSPTEPASGPVPAAIVPSPGSDPIAQASLLLQAFITEADEDVSHYQQSVSISLTLEALQHVAMAYAGVPGRKSLIWATGSFPFLIDSDTGFPQDSSPIAAYERTMQMLASANIAVYPVDVRGLMVNVAASHTSSLMTLETFASMTGGRAFYNRNDLTGSFREASGDSSAYYELSYYLDKSNTKAGWRKLNVKVRREDVRVRARSGFFVTPTTINPAYSKEMDLANALQSPMDYTALPLTVRWLEDKGKPGKKRKISFEIVLPAKTATIDDADGNRLSLEFAAVARNGAGETAANFSQTVQSRLNPQALEQIRDSGVTYSNALEFAPGEYVVRFVVRDNVSGRTGSVLAPLKVM